METRYSEGSPELTEVDQNTSSRVDNPPAPKSVARSSATGWLPVSPSHISFPPQTAGLSSEGGCAQASTRQVSRSASRRRRNRRGGCLSLLSSPPLCFLTSHPPEVTSLWELVEGRSGPLKQCDPPVPAGVNAVLCGCVGCTGLTSLYELFL